jgi:spore maturation protein CgeB
MADRGVGFYNFRNFVECVKTTGRNGNKQSLALPGGHELHFQEREHPWHASNRDLPRPDFCRLTLYRSLAEPDAHRTLIAGADAAVIGSYVPDAASLLDWVEPKRGGLLCFYDIDAPVTLLKIEATMGTCCPG